MNQQQLDEVAEELIQVYSSQAKALDVLGKIGLGPADYPEGAGSARNAWHSLVPDLFNSDQLRALLQAAAADPKAKGRRDQLLGFLNLLGKSASVGQFDNAQERSTRLLERTILHANPDDSRAALAQELTRVLVEEHNLAGAMLVDATRFAIECQLLFEPELTAESMLEVMRDRRFAGGVEYAKEKGFEGIPVRVEPQDFFMRTRAREHDWYRYFEAVHRTLSRLRVANATLCTIRSRGFVAPQFLVAGLLSQFADDWGRVLAVYGDQTSSASNFGCLQASQWNTWLMWGPSIPICSCEEWQNLQAAQNVEERQHVQALQYGYGDETNSLPLVANGKDGQVVSVDGERLFANAPWGSPRKINGRLRWAPWLFHPDGRRADDSSSADNWKEEAAKVTAARAQRLIYGELGQPEPTRGLMLQSAPSAEFEAPSHSARWYYSAYQWLMFLVACRPVEGATPIRLSGTFPPPSAPRPYRKGQLLWGELLPVFVHANVADAGALEMQRIALVESAVGLLRRVWAERETLLPKDPEKLGFWLVCASDHSGCGHRVRFAATDSLASLLAARLRECPDAEFVQAVVLPSENQPPETRSPVVARFYSACHLPELITDYYSYIDEL